MEEGLPKRQVEAYVDGLLRDNAEVRRLVEAMNKAGCPVDRSYFKVAPCEGNTRGGFSLEHGVILCHNRLDTATDVQNTVTHELIHAYDNCRAKGLDFSNCQEHACTEVRAALLSGDCTFMQELLRGNVSLNPGSWSGFQERCVARRAALSVALNPGCSSDEGVPCAAVASVFARCMADKAPFDSVPRSIL